MRNVKRLTHPGSRFVRPRTLSGATHDVSACLPVRRSGADLFRLQRRLGVPLRADLHAQHGVLRPRRRSGPTPDGPGRDHPRARLLPVRDPDRPRRRPVQPPAVRHHRRRPDRRRLPAAGTGAGVPRDPRRPGALGHRLHLHLRRRPGLDHRRDRDRTRRDGVRPQPADQPGRADRRHGRGRRARPDQPAAADDAVRRRDDPARPDPGGLHARAELPPDAARGARDLPADGRHVQARTRGRPAASRRTDAGGDQPDLRTVQRGVRPAVVGEDPEFRASRPCSVRRIRRSGSRCWP